MPVRFDLRPWSQWLPPIHGRVAELGTASDEALRARAEALRSPQGLEPTQRIEAFALVAEAARRTVGLSPFDEQLLGGMALCEGALVEMQTGEGKTLVAVFPAVIAALEGRHAHLLGFNDYLARRDAAWMGPIYRALGIDVGVIQDGGTPAERRAAYRADVTYATAKQVGFDRLRDAIATSPADRVLGPLDDAIVDEADALLVDEARVPLVLAGAFDGGHADVATLAALVGRLAPGEDFDVDELGRIVTLTDRGLTRCEEALGGDDLHTAGREELLAALHCALHARALLRRDRDYIVRDDRIEIVDENTGRVVRDRKWPEGLHAALEAKEGVSVRPRGTVLATTTVRELLARYRRRCGMTATARPAAEELKDTHGLATVVIPPHAPNVREDLPDRLFATRAAKEAAVLDEVARAHARGRPVLLGTRTVEESEAFAAALVARGYAVQVLNARHDEREAAIVADAGRRGAITIATNMAGRGTDIRLGGSNGEDHDAVAALGGLYVIGTSRHDSRRIDDQLRGRAGRQGDPGSSRFFVSLEDDLPARAGARESVPARLCAPDANGELDPAVLGRWLDHLQRVVDGQGAAMRRGVAAYGDLLAHQEGVVAELRDEVMAGGAPLLQELAQGADPALAARVILLAIDRRWSEHVSFAFALRETIVLERLAGKEPLVEHDRRLGAAFAEILPAVRVDVAATLAAHAAGALGSADPRLAGPSSTWTYLVDDDPFGERFAASPFGGTGAAAAAALLWPLVLLWGVVRLVRRPKSPKPGSRVV